MQRVYTIPINITYPTLLRDAPTNNSVLERYLHDIHLLYLNKLTSFIMYQGVDKSDLRSMLEEIIKVKTLLNSEENTKGDTIE